MTEEYVADCTATPQAIQALRRNIRVATKGEEPKYKLEPVLLRQGVVFLREKVESKLATEELEKANIILNRQLLPGDIKAGRHYMHPSGIRIGVPETTRLGMKESEMKEIANFIKGIVIDKKDPVTVARKVEDFRKEFQKVHYAFDTVIGAYEYISLVGRSTS